MNCEVYMEVTHGRRNKNKTNFRAVINKVLVSGLVLATVLGSTTPAFAASISMDNLVESYQHTIVQEFGISLEQSISNIVNTINELNKMKLAGQVSSSQLQLLASQIYSLEKFANTANKQQLSEVKVVLEKAEAAVKGLKGASEVEVAIAVVRGSLGIDSHTVTQAKAGITFPDVQKGHWFYDTVTRMTQQGFINGFPDGTFKPQNTISYAEYLALLTRTTGAKSTYVSGEGDAWYSSAVAAAYENQILKQGEVFDFTKAISRAEAAMFTERAVQQVLGEDSLNTLDIENLIKDFSKIEGTKYEYYVLQQYAKGIIMGDNAGNFNPTSNLTRAEAATIILRTIETDGRRDMSKVDLTDKEVQTIPQTGSGVIEEGPYAGRMHTVASTELDLQALSTARFYKENGKLYVSINLPELPNGFKWQWGINAYDKNNEYVFYTTRNRTDGASGQQVIEIVSKYDNKTINDIAVTTLSVAVINESRQSMVSHKLSTDAKGQVLRQSSVDSSNASWETFDTSAIFKW